MLMPLTFIQGGLALSPVQLSEGLPYSNISQAFKCVGSSSIVFFHIIRSTACEKKMSKMRVCKQIMRLVFGPISHQTFLNTEPQSKEQGKDHSWDLIMVGSTVNVLRSKQFIKEIQKELTIKACMTSGGQKLSLRLQNFSFKQYYSVNLMSAKIVIHIKQYSNTEMK